MRKVKLQMQLSIDGFVARPSGELDWMIWDWDDELKNYVGAITDSIDCILLGRKLAEGFIPYWESVAADPDNPEFEAGKIFQETPKIVFSKTLEKTEWKNTQLTKDDVAEEITYLKKQQGKDIIVYGGASFVNALIRNDIIDEYYFFVNPVAIGKGLSIFTDLEQKMKLVNAKSFECGIALLCYKPIN